MRSERIPVRDRKYLDVLLFLLEQLKQLFTIGNRVRAIGEHDRAFSEPAEQLLECFAYRTLIREGSKPLLDLLCSSILHYLLPLPVDRKSLQKMVPFYV